MPINFWLGGPFTYHVFHPLALPFRVYSTTTERQELLIVADRRSVTIDDYEQP